MTTAHGMFHLGWFLNGTSAPRFGMPWSGNIGTQWKSGELFVDLARAMERARFDFVLVEDNAFIGDRYRDSMEVYLKHAIQAPRHDPVLTAMQLLQATRHLGVIPTIGSYAYHPYLLARMIGTLDQMSEGRAGANLVTGTSDRAAQNYGLDAMEEHDLRYEKADEFLEIVVELWNSWDQDALLADRAAGTFADHTRVHIVDHQGEWYSSRGPLNSGPVSPGGPVISQAGGSPRGRDFASKHADVIVANNTSIEAMKEYRLDVRGRVAALGRDPDQTKVMFVVSPHVCESMEEAVVRRKLKDAELAEGIDVELARMSKSTDFDFGAFPLDTPLREVEFSTNGTQGIYSFLAKHADLSLREAVLQRFAAPGMNLFGTADSVAHEMIDIADEIGGDGFLIGSDGITRRFVAEITDGLLPRLQDLGAVRTEYLPGNTLRDSLLEF